jgi:HlyD family secretion protein
VRAGGGPGSLSGEERARLRACREQLAGSAGSAGRQRGGTGQGGAEPEVETRPAVVFVQAAAGTEARRVVLGMSDWEFTEVVEGLAPGEQVVLVSVAQLQQRQQEFASRMRERMSGPLGRSGSSTSRGGTATGTGGGTRQRGN